MVCHTYGSVRHVLIQGHPKMEGGIGYNAYTTLKKDIEHQMALGEKGLPKEDCYLLNKSVDNLPAAEQQAWLATIPITRAESKLTIPQSLSHSSKGRSAV